MSIFSSIGHALSTGYHDVTGLFGGGGNNNNVVTTTTTLAPLQKPAISRPAPQQPDVMALLQKPANNSPFDITNPASLQKANPTTPVTTQTTTAAPPQQPKPSVWHSITHNPVTNVAGGVGKAIAQPFVQLGKGVGQIPTAVAGEIASESSDPYVRQAGIDAVNHAQKAAFGTNDSGTIAKKIVGSTAGAMLTVAAPGIDNLAEAGAAKALPAFAETGLLKVGARTASNAAIGGGFNTISGVERGDSGTKLLKDFGEGAAVGGAGGAIFSGVPLLRKAVFPGAAADTLPARVGETVSETATDVGGPQAADEIAVGIKPGNPEPVPGEGAPVEPTPGEPVPHPISTGDTLEPGAPQPIPQPNFPQVEPLKPISTPDAPSVGNPATTTPSLPGASPSVPSVPISEVDNTPAYIRKAEQAKIDAAGRAEAEANAKNLGGDLGSLDRPTFQHKQDIQAVISDAEQQLNDFINEHPEATQADIEQAQVSLREQAANKIQELQNARAGVNTDTAPAPTAAPVATPNPAEIAAAVAEQKPVAPGLDAQGNPMQVMTETAAKQAETAGVSPNQGAPSNPAEVQAVRTATEPSVPGNGDLKNARFNQAMVDNAKDPTFKQAFTSDPIEKDGAPLTELQNIATEKVSKMGLPELVANYGRDFGESGPVGTPAQYYEHLQALRQLEQYSGDPTAAEAAANALAAVNDYAYRQGRGLAATKVAYDNMPTSMKVAYVAKQVQRAGGDLNATDLKRLYAAADVQGQLAKTAQELEHRVSELATSANKSDPAWSGQMKQALAAEREAQTNLYDQNRIVVDVMDKNMPKSPLGDRIAQSARTSMLSSMGGRVFALTGTGFNTAQLLADNVLSTVFGKGINAIRGSNEVKASFARPTTLVKGAVTGAKGLAKEAFGNPGIKNVDEYLKKPGFDSEYSHDATRYGFIGTHITAPLRKLVRFGVGSHLALTKGVEDVSLEQSARQAATELGVPKENMGSFVDYYKTHAPKNAAEEAKQAWLGVNNLHQNGVSNALGKFASVLDNLGAKAGGKDAGIISGIAKQFRTVVIPFSHYMGGAVDKMITDRNMFYNVYKIARANSPQELSDNLARLTTNVGTAVGLGYGLSKAGVITDKDADGKSYDGLYFHVGNRYIPVAWAGQAAMPIIMGATFNHAMNDGTKGNSWPTRVIDVTTKMATGTTDSVLKAAGVAGTFGDTTGPNQIFTGDSGKGLPAFAGTGIRQHIPGVFGDVNSFLDYNNSLNPTHEKALTKATSVNPATGRDVTNSTQTEINKTKAAIPFISQTLPRQQGEQAHDFVDRMLHSGQASGTQIQAQKDAVVQQKQSDYDLAQGIPDPNGKYDTQKGESFTGAVNGKIANNEYDKAIPALQQKLDSYKNDDKVDPATTKKLKDQIKELGVTKDYGDQGQRVRQLYLNTSVSAWRDMGDPESDTYNPDAYKLLYDYDSKLAKQGVSDATGDNSKNKFTAKKPGKGGRGGNSNSAVTSNTIGGLPKLDTLSFGNLGLEKVSTAASIPTIQQMRPGDLIKKRAISVSPVR